MNTTFKATLALGAAGLSLIGMAGGASAQTTTGDPNLTTVFSTVATGKTPSFTTGALGVGFDANNGGGKLPSSAAPAAAQSIYEAFTFDSSAAGPFSTLASGSLAQIQVFASNNNVITGANFDIYASLYAYNPTAAAGAVPATGSNLFGAQQKVTLGAATGGYFSGDFKLAAPIVAGQNYVLGLTTLTGDTQDFAQVAVSSKFIDGLATGDQVFDSSKFVTTNNDQGNPTGQSINTNLSNTDLNQIAFRLDAAPPAAVPEAGTSLGFVLGLGLMGAAFAAKRRRSVAK